MPYVLTPELRVAASPELLSRGCVYILDVDQIKSEVGERWARVKDSVWGHLHNLLRQRLAPTDFYAQISDMAVLVSMPSRSPDEAQVCCLGIVHALHATMLGSSDHEEVVVQRAILLADGNIGTAPAPKIGISASQMVASNSVNLGTENMAPLADYHHLFSPMWNAQKEAITAYRCSTNRSCIDDALSNTVRSKLEVAMTASRIRHAAKVLSERLTVSQRFVTWIPLSYELICSPANRLEIAATLRELSGELRPFLILEIERLPQGVPQSRLSELVASLKPFCRGVVAQLPARTANYGSYLSAGLHGIGLSLSAENTWETEMLSEVFKLAVAAGKQQIMSFVLDVPNANMLLAARSHGATFISGPMIGPVAQLPGQVRLLAAGNIAPRDIVSAA